MAGSAEYVEKHDGIRSARRGSLKRLFHAELARTGVPGQWVDVDGHANLEVLRLGSCADLIVAGQDDPNDPESYIGDRFPETLVMSAGRPVLLIPYTGVFPAIGESVMIAWNGSREAARAVHDVLPILKAAKRTTAVSINGMNDEPFGSRIPGADIAAVVARHGVKVDIADIDGVIDAPVGDLLMSRSSDLGADLVVMGAYGHARWQELVLGGATRTMFKSMTVPVVMSH
jgi:nucleotide-binding universal stress UspA family protein